MPAPKHLTEQQRRFAEGVAVHGVLLKAAEDAGYRHAAHVGTRLLKNPLVKAEVKRLRAKIEARSDKAVIADGQELQGFLTRIVRGQEKDVELSLSGDPIERAPTLETRRKASMDLAKIQGLLKDKVEHTGTVVLAEMSFRELLELARLGGEGR